MGYRYIGSKARIANAIMDYIGKPESPDGYFIDSFSGTGVVASIAADNGWNVRINDMMLNAAVVSEAHLLAEADVPFRELGGYEKAIELLQVNPKEGFFWREYSPASLEITGIERKYFTEDNAKRIDGAVSTLHEWLKKGTITRKEFSLLAASLIYAVNDIANIAGTYGCFLSKWTQQAGGTLSIPVLPLRKSKVNYEVSALDVFDVKSNETDTVYLDPPYTKRQYASYYHILETIVKGDAPKIQGVAGLRPWKNQASIFCYKAKALGALVKLVTSQQANRVVISYSNDGHIQLDDLERELNKTGSVIVMEIGTIGRYRPNQAASINKAQVKEYLIDYRKN